MGSYNFFWRVMFGMNNKKITWKKNFRDGETMEENYGAYLEKKTEAPSCQSWRVNCYVSSIVTTSDLFFFPVSFHSSEIP